jgi:hypothetical protein
MPIHWLYRFILSKYLLALRVDVSTKVCHLIDQSFHVDTWSPTIFINPIGQYFVLRCGNYTGDTLMFCTLNNKSIPR